MTSDKTTDKMTQLIVVGTIGIDDVKTPFGDHKGIIGGSASYACYAASFFARAGMVAITGKDMDKQYFDIMKGRGINLDGVQIKGKTFRWSGSYEFDMNEAKTHLTELNSLEEFSPKLPQSYKETDYVFLGNIHPSLQIQVIDQVKDPKLVVLDTMNFWIDSAKDQLIEAIKKVDVLLLNDGEARQLFETVSLVQAANKALKLGPRYVIIKKGEHGAMLFTKDSHFNAPGYPLEVIKDPTGCGDSFAGAFLGYIAKKDDTGEATIRKAIVYGSTVASFNAEDFSLNRLKKLTYKDIEARYKEFEKMREF